MQEFKEYAEKLKNLNFEKVKLKPNFKKFRKYDNLNTPMKQSGEGGNKQIQPDPSIFKDEKSDFREPVPET